jgi:hypothetical protein
MKKQLLFFGLAFLICGNIWAQNLQVHYDLGENRNHLTTTLEMFKPDAWGNTFFFVDFDYNAGDVEGVSLAYMEIARALKFWESPLAVQVEYNGGFGQFTTPGGNMAYQINDAWLSGLQYTFNNSDFSKVFTLQLLYKNIRGKHDFSYQLTGVWGLHFFDRKVSFMGFADFWREDMNYIGTDKVTEFVFLTEPQIWYNFSSNFSLGTEIEISSNFGGNKGFMINPTLAVRWTF